VFLLHDTVAKNVQRQVEEEVNDERGKNVEGSSSHLFYGNILVCLERLREFGKPVRA
jgi:hypothetical protein